MTTILHLRTSPMGEKSFSRKLGAHTLDALLARHPGAHVTVRDLDAAPLSHINGITLSAFFTAPEQRNAAQQEAIKASDAAVDEVLAADILIIESPMWNFGIPSVLKAWVDHVARAGRTFQYTATGPVPLTPAGKKAILVVSRGGIYSSGPAASMEHQESYLRTFLGFIGITDVVAIHAEGLSRGDDAVAHALATAEAELQTAIVA